MKMDSAAEMVNAAGRKYGDIIREYRRRKNLSQEQLGALVQVKKNAVGAWEAGRSRPDIASVPILCEALDLSLSAFFGVEEEGAYDTLNARFHRLNDYNRQVILRQMDALYEVQKDSLSTPAPAPSPRRLVPVYRNDLSAAAGFSYTIGDPSGEKVYLAEDPITMETDEIIRVSGDSMEPTFHSGDEVFVRHCASLKEGEIGIFVNGDAGYIKEYRRDGLYSHNPAYPPMRFSDEDSVRLIGRVMGRLRPEQLATPAEIAAWTDFHMT